MIADGTLRAKRVRRTVFVTAADVWMLMGLEETTPRVTAADRALLRRVGVG